MKGDPFLVGRLKAKLKLPVMAGPMFIASTPDLVIAQCRAGIIGSMPALNARTTLGLDADLTRIGEALPECPAPYAINLVCHRTTARLSADLGMSVVVEGIETNEQLELISADGTVSEAQGYLFSRPVPAVRVRQLLNASHGRRQVEVQAPRGFVAVDR